MSTEHNLLQGSIEWDQFRLTHYGASEAPAMLGLSLNVKRSELLRAKHTGNPKEFSDWVQEHILNEGHRVEAQARPLVEKIVGDELYPVTRSVGKISASCDGLTLDETIAFEHKQWNEESAALVREGTVPPQHMPQCQQVLAVTGAEKLIFVVSDGTPDRLVYTWVTLDVEWFERIRAGWAQFEQDLVDYVPPEPEQAKPTGHAPERLPALRIEITGEVTASNLEEFKATALDAIRAIKTELVTDEDFADGELAVKWCTEVETRTAAAKEYALGQTATIDGLFKALDEIGAEARRVRLAHEKLIDKRKLARKDEIVVKARQVYAEFVTELRKETENLWIALIAPAFSEAIKNKRSFASMQDAVDTMLANAKIDASATAKRIRNVLAHINAQTEHLFLFNDKALLIHKPLDDVQLVVSTRIAAHEAKEAEKKRAAEAAKAIAAAPAVAIAPPGMQVGSGLLHATAEYVSGVVSVKLGQAEPSAAPAPGERGTVNVGEICRRLGYIVTTDFIENKLGVLPTHTDRRSTYWTEAQVKMVIGPKLAAHTLRALTTVQERQAEAVA